MVNFNRQFKVGLLLIAPQLLVTLLFFVWPAGQALFEAFWFSDAFGLQRWFAGLDNFRDLLADPGYLQAIKVTVFLSFSITVLTLGLGLMLAVLVSQRTRSAPFYKTLLLWPYAVAPAVAALLWRFLCHPVLGWLTEVLAAVGVEFNYLTHPLQALLVIIFTASWQQFSYNFLFFLAALNALPRPLFEAALLDGASAWRQFWQIKLPLLSPTLFFLLIMNLIYSFFDTFGIIHVITNGGPGGATTTLMYKVYEDGVLGMDLGSASAQSVILMLMVAGLTLIQFRYLDRKVHYQ